MASLTLKSRHIILEAYNGRYRMFGWSKACYDTDGTRTVTMFEPTPVSMVSDGIPVNTPYEISGFMFREGSDMVDMSCVATSKCTGGQLFPA